MVGNSYGATADIGGRQASHAVRLKHEAVDCEAVDAIKKLRLHRKIATAIFFSKYRFSLAPNLDKLLSDRRANAQSFRIAHCVNTAIQKVFSAAHGITRQSG